MDCKELTNDLLADYAGWKLGPQERELVAAHLEGCGPCGVRRDEVEAMASALRLTSPKPPAALLDQLDRAVLDGLPARKVGRRPRLWPWAAAALLLLGVTGLVSVLSLKPKETPTPVVVTPNRPIENPEPLPKPEFVPPPKPDLPSLAQPPDRAKEGPKPEPSSAPASPGASEGKPKPDLPAVAQPPDRAKVEPKPDLPSVAQPPDRAKEGPKPDAPKPPPLPPPPPKVIVLGDVNGDGTVDIADARSLQQALVLGLPLPPEADVNGDGVVDVADVRQITRAEVAAR